MRDEVKGLIMSAEAQDGDGKTYTDAQMDEMEGLADDLRERMVRALGKDRSRMHVVLSMLVADTLGNAADSSADLDLGIEQLVKNIKSRAPLVRLLKLVESIGA